MKKYIGCDSHQRYSVFVTMDEKGEAGVPVRMEHGGSELRKFLRTLPSGSGSGGSQCGWYWFVDALEEAGLEPHLANPLEAKKQMPGRNKTDKLDARGLATLLRVGALLRVFPVSSPDKRVFSRRHSLTGANDVENVPMPGDLRANSQLPNTAPSWSRL